MKQSKCKICRINKKLYFDTGRMKICKSCISILNNYGNASDQAYLEINNRIFDRITRKIIYDAHHENIDNWRKQKAKKALKSYINFKQEHDASDAYWRKRLLSEKSIPAKIIRAEKTHNLIYKNPPLKKEKPQNWDARARAIRIKDNLKCNKCGQKDDVTLDVHHIVHVNNLGTHRQSNLVTLCRECHQKEHDHLFNFNTDGYSISNTSGTKFIKQGNILNESVSPLNSEVINKSKHEKIVKKENDYDDLYFLLNQIDIDLPMIKAKIKKLKNKGYTERNIQVKIANYESNLANESLSFVISASLEKQGKNKTYQNSKGIKSSKNEIENKGDFFDKYSYIFFLIIVAAFLYLKWFAD